MKFVGGCKRFGYIPFFLIGQSLLVVLWGLIIRWAHMFQRSCFKDQIIPNYFYILFNVFVCALIFFLAVSVFRNKCKIGVLITSIIMLILGGCVALLLELLIYNPNAMHDMTLPLLFIGVLFPGVIVVIFAFGIVFTMNGLKLHKVSKHDFNEMS